MPEILQPIDNEIRLPFSDVSLEEAQALLDLTDVWHYDNHPEVGYNEPWPSDTQFRYLRIWKNEENHVRRIVFWNKSNSPCHQLGEVMQHISSHLPYLESLEFEDPTLSEYPQWLSNYPNLKSLSFTKAQFSSLPPNFFDIFPHLSRIEFDLPHLIEFPIPTTVYPSLTLLELIAGSAFTTLPDRFDLFPSLEHLHLGHMPHLTEIPTSIQAARIDQLHFDHTGIRTMSEAFFKRYRQKEHFLVNGVDLFLLLRFPDCPTSERTAFLFREHLIAVCDLPIPRIRITNTAWPTYREDWQMFSELFPVVWFPDGSYNLDRLNETTNRYERWVHLRRTGRPITRQFAHEDYSDFEHLFGHCDGFIESKTVDLSKLARRN